ncbi:phage holin [Gordonia soli]|uniref:Holin n=1 Tax=Gordonia soli NBRC 108243 TaxID=1223545 RepID=M0QPU8_9ACTN|nr:hypothetical protein [Gordonia soli]GAC70715.1 hypothetical protein GS4_39_00460 [Gordonia soli NBRC 108243]
MSSTILEKLGLKATTDWISIAYTALPTATAGASIGAVATGDKSALWAGIVTAFLAPLIAFVRARSISTLRPLLYAAVGAVQLGLLGYGIASQVQVGIWLPVVSTALAGLTGGIMNANTASTSAFTGNAQGIADPNAPVAE